MRFAAAFLILAAFLINGNAGDVTEMMKEDFLLAFKKPIEYQSVDEFPCIWSNHQIDEDRMAFMMKARKGILKMLKNEFRRDPIYEFKNIGKLPYNQRDINEMVVALSAGSAPWGVVGKP